LVRCTDARGARASQAGGARSGGGGRRVVTSEGPRIHDYAVVGDSRSAALISRRGSLDWLCWPRFDSPSLFGAILDPQAGRFSIAPVGELRSERWYAPDTNVLCTRFSAADGEV